MRTAFLLAFTILPLSFAASEWRQFRGPNGSGVSDAKGVPVVFGVDQNVLWKTPLPPGHSSPVFSPDRIFLTAHENESLFVIGLDRKAGKELWRKQVPRPRKGELHKANGPASASPVTDGDNVYVFFTDFGLISFTKDGKERWKHGGGSVWETATYDAESDTFYQGIGNAGPDWDPEYRPGDNKWAASVLALSPSDGKIKWGYQYTPNDPYDFDEISEHPIIKIKVNGQDRKLVVHAARNGFFYALDSNNGSFVAGQRRGRTSSGSPRACRW